MHIHVNDKFAEQIVTRLEDYHSVEFKDVPDVSHYGNGFHVFMELTQAFLDEIGLSASDISCYLSENHGDRIEDMIVYPRYDSYSTLLFIKERDNGKARNSDNP